MKKSVKGFQGGDEYVAILYEVEPKDPVIRPRIPNNQWPQNPYPQQFLLRGEFIIKGQGRVIETGCAYRVKDEAWLWLCGTTTIVVMEEGEQRGECLRCTQESRELILAERDGPRKVRKRAKKLLDEMLQALASSSRLHRPW
jgi:hypothetical protein